VEFWPSGNSGNANGSQTMFPITGYLVRKNTNVSRNLQTNAGNVVRPAMYIRLAELYLNYAEALNESNPGHADVLTYLNAVRTRAGIPAIAAGLDQAAMRALIRVSVAGADLGRHHLRRHSPAAGSNGHRSALRAW
jgi:hypothetical protein